MEAKEQRQVKRRLQQFTEMILFLESLKTSSYFVGQEKRIDGIVTDVQMLQQEFELQMKMEAGTFQFSESFLKTIYQYVLTIAKQQRNEEQLQPVSLLHDKFEQELSELETASEFWDELPDVTYYAACLFLQGEDVMKRLAVLALRYKVTLNMLETATLAKYQRRAAGHPKDIQAERHAIFAALAGLKI